MTDEKTRAEQIALIKGSVEAWNAWRVGRTDKPDLSGANLVGADLRWADMRDANMSHADMSHANMSGADLSWIDLRDADMRGANLVGANLRCINLSLASRREGFKIHRLIARVSRSDSHLFMGFLTDAGLIIMAGCRLMSPDEYRAHVAKEYPDTPKAEETLGVIQYIEDCAKEQEKEGWTADDQ